MPSPGLSLTCFQGCHPHGHACLRDFSVAKSLLNKKPFLGVKQPHTTLMCHGTDGIEGSPESVNSTTEQEDLNVRQQGTNKITEQLMEAVPHAAFEVCSKICNPGLTSLELQVLSDPFAAGPSIPPSCTSRSKSLGGYSLCHLHLPHPECGPSGSAWLHPAG